MYRIPNNNKANKIISAFIYYLSYQVDNYANATG